MWRFNSVRHLISAFSMTRRKESLTLLDPQVKVGRRKCFPVWGRGKSYPRSWPFAGGRQPDALRGACSGPRPVGAQRASTKWRKKEIRSAGLLLFRGHNPPLSLLPSNAEEVPGPLGEIRTQEGELFGALERGSMPAVPPGGPPCQLQVRKDEAGRGR